MLYMKEINFNEYFLLESLFSGGVEVTLMLPF